MADEHLRDIEREAAQGDPGAVLRLLTERQRLGLFPPIPWCPGCHGEGGPPNNTPAGRYMNHAGYEPCKQCGGTGQLSGSVRVQLGAFANDEIAREILDPTLKRWNDPKSDDPIRIPACDQYEWEIWLQCCMFKFGRLVGIVAVIGAARIYWDNNYCLPEDQCNCGERDTCLACQAFSKVYMHVDAALDVFEAWCKEPTSSNLVKLAGRADYGRTYQRLFEGCDALASRHGRGGAIFWEGIRTFSESVTSEVLGVNLRSSVAKWTREGCW